MMKDKESPQGPRAFDYQERWHGWGSPVGLGVFLLSISGAVFWFFVGTAALLGAIEGR